MGRRRISILLMVVTIATIALFQAWWLRKNYLEENRLLTLRTHLLFRETLFKLQASKLHLDTSIRKNIRMPDPTAALSAVNILRESISIDSLEKKGHHAQSIIVTMRSDTGDHPTYNPDIGIRKAFFSTQGGGGVTAFLSSVDSLQQPLAIREIHDKFAGVLASEGIHAGFIIDTAAAAVREKDRVFGQKDPLITRDDEGSVILGFARPVIYRVQLENTFWLIARRLGPQLLFSLVLVGVTILSFLLLYRNWRQQQKLTILKNDFISNITHELKTPIATVSVAVEALKEFDALKDPVRTREYLEISTHELQRLSLLVDKVLKLSLFEKQEIELRKVDFDLKTLVEDIMKSMRLQFEKYQASVRFWSEPDEPGPAKSDAGRFRLRGDKLHLTSVIFNLLDNALKYSKETPTVTVDLHGDADHILLSVSDNGIGIPAGYKDRIFEKFFRVPMGDQHNVKGYGLGLSYVAHVVQRHGGEIDVRSKEGVGSQFTIKIPRDHV